MSCSEVEEVESFILDIEGEVGRIGVALHNSKLEDFAKS